MTKRKAKKKPVKKRTKRDMNPFELSILITLRRFRRPLNIQEIADGSKIHWLTAKNHLKTLSRKKKVVVIPGKRKKYKLR